VAFSPDGKFLASASHDATVKVWDLTGGDRFQGDLGKETKTLRVHAAGWVEGLAFTPDGGRLVSAGRDKTVRVWDPVTGEELRSLAGHTAPLTAVALSPDGRRLASCGQDGGIRVWDAATWEQVLHLQGHNGTVTSLAFGPDGRRLISGGVDKTVRVWDLRTGKEALQLRNHSYPVRGVAFSPDGRRLAAASRETAVLVSSGEVTVWDGTPDPAR
jgi:WD40 repeat protein